LDTFILEKKPISILTAKLIIWKQLCLNNLAKIKTEILLALNKWATLKIKEKNRSPIKKIKLIQKVYWISKTTYTIVVKTTLIISVILSTDQLLIVVNSLLIKKWLWIAVGYQLPSCLIRFKPKLELRSSNSDVKSKKDKGKSSIDVELE
jgi:hypothetical protein